MLRALNLRFLACAILALMPLSACSTVDEACKGDNMDLAEQITTARDAATEAARTLGIGDAAVEVQDRDGKTSLGKDDPTLTRRAFRLLGSLDAIGNDEVLALLDTAQGELERDWAFVPTDSSATSRWSERGDMTATLTVSGPDSSGSRTAMAEVTTACAPTADFPPR